VAKTTNKDAILLMQNEYTIESALNLLESWLKTCGFPYKHKETNNGQNRHSFIIQHDIGMKVSVYLATLFQSLFDAIKSLTAVLTGLPDWAIEIVITLYMKVSRPKDNF
jgi:hypothetical protein